ncbi:transketolase [Yinghuangia seranimata]|uniref:transketolase n=1 Tax=Yinghuangia seranimata TaxID=408067 RepID=UPI00248AC886|nr:transketolase [Yinghuangia seranimata]MDI2125491.1 transketolase [Yinghuangia seranimata]
MDHPQLTELARTLRVDSVRASSAAGSGHPTSSLSAADLMAVLLGRRLRYDFADPGHPGNDRLVFSKGHATPLLYAMYRAVGAVSDDELLTFRTRGSRLEGHPTPRLPWVDFATGSLGQGLPMGAALAWGILRLEAGPARVWVLSGDGETAEGSVWEAAEFAGAHGLGNLTLVLDVNRLGQRGPTRHGWDLDAYATRFAAFGWHTVTVDGHDIAAIDAAYGEALDTTDRPTAVIARTMKGRGVPDVENREGAHGKPVPDEARAIAALGGEPSRQVVVPVRPPLPTHLADRETLDKDADLPVYEVGDEVPTRKAFGEALAALGDVRGDVVAVDGEVGDSTGLNSFAERHPSRFLECYIAEQQLAASAVALQTRGWLPFASTFAAFLTRAHDFLRMAAIGHANVCMVGSHAGTSIGQDGPSQMGLEDLAMFRALHGSTVLYPCDANQTARLVAAMAEATGIRYLRTTRGATPVVYGADAVFPVGGSRLLRPGDGAQVTVAAAGITVHAALAAADRLAERGVPVRVLDLYSVKPVDTEALYAAAAATACLITVEDHRPEGGLGDAVAETFARTDAPPAPRLVRLAVRHMPGSATPGEQLAESGIDADAVETAVLACLA